MAKAASSSKKAAEQAKIASKKDLAKQKKEEELKKQQESSSESESSSSDDSDSSSDEEVQVEEMKGSVKKDAASSSDESSSDDDSEESGSSDDGSDDSSSASSSSDEEEEEKEAEAAPAAVDEKPKRKADDEKIKESPKKAKTDADHSGSPVVCFANLPWSVNENSLRAVIKEKSLEVKEMRLCTDHMSRFKGVAFVTFDSVETAKKACEVFNLSNMEGREIRANQAAASAPAPKERQQMRNAKKNPPSNVLFVGNLSFKVSCEQLKKEFSPFGAVKAARIPTDQETGRMKGYGYVEFANMDEAKFAMERMLDAKIDNRPIRLDFAPERKPARQ